MTTPFRLGGLTAAGQGVRAYPRTVHTPKVLPEFAPEIMIEVLRPSRRAIEILVRYYARLAGESRRSTGYPHLARTALRMLRLIVQRRLGG